ncbi:protein MGARP isoform X2 [Hemicordylus capensis]|uniref:protein MGARP isoform X2 n=1 Tax=Hemicordylus capensis TaxID=884348 RepID=UPI0023033381|nr:protein MGARP isoform X2 [Hemicordylus capensis]
MHLCRIAWQNLSSRLTRVTPLLRGHVPFRQMSSGSVPGSSGENLIYYLLVIGAAGAGGFYAYKTVSSDKARYNERIDDIKEKNTAEWKPKPWPPESLESDEMETKEVTEVSEEAKPATEESEATITGESEVQSEGPTESAEAEKREESPVEEASSGVQEEEQDAAASSEAAPTQGTPENALDTKVLSPEEENLEGSAVPAAQERPASESRDSA